MGDAYNDLVKFLESSDVSNNIDTSFVDLIEDEDIEEYGTIKQMIDKGFALPLTAINGQVRLYGGISIDMIYDLIKKSI